MPLKVTFPPPETFPVERAAARAMPEFVSELAPFDVKFIAVNPVDVLVQDIAALIAMYDDAVSVSVLAELQVTGFETVIAPLFVPDPPDPTLEIVTLHEASAFCSVVVLITSVTELSGT